MISGRRVLAEADTAGRTFLRRRTAMMFTFLFPLIIVIIFGALISTDPGSEGLFTEDPAFYLAGYIGVVVLFTPLSRLSAEVIRHRTDNRFEKLATTPLTRTEWLLAHTLVTTAVVTIAAVLVVVVLALLAGTPIPRSPVILAFIVAGVFVFSGIGALIGRLASTQDGAIAVANTIALPILFLAETFIPPDLLPAWLHPVIAVLPLTPFSRGVRTIVTDTGDPWLGSLLLLSGLGVTAFLLGVWALPRAD